jgi:hypothetical protein
MKTIKVPMSNELASEQSKALCVPFRKNRFDDII